MGLACAGPRSLDEPSGKGGVLLGKLGPISWRSAREALCLSGVRDPLSPIRQPPGTDREVDEQAVMPAVDVKVVRYQGGHPLGAKSQPMAAISS